MQAPDKFAGQLRSKLQSLGETEDIPPSDVHRRIFPAAEQAWRDYICYLDDELAPLVRCDCVQIKSIDASNMHLGRKGVLCRCRHLQRIRLPDRVRRQPEAAAASSKTSEM